MSLPRDAAAITIGNRRATQVSLERSQAVKKESVTGSVVRRNGRVCAVCCMCRLTFVLTGVHHRGQGLVPAPAWATFRPGKGYNFIEDLRCARLIGVDERGSGSRER